MEKIIATSKPGTVKDALMAAGTHATHSSVRRDIAAGAVRINETEVTSLDSPVVVGDTIRVGKSRFITVV